MGQGVGREAGSVGQHKYRHNQDGSAGDLLRWQANGGSRACRGRHLPAPRSCSYRSAFLIQRSGQGTGRNEEEDRAGVSQRRRRRRAGQATHQGQDQQVATCVMYPVSARRAGSRQSGVPWRRKGMQRLHGCEVMYMESVPVRQVAVSGVTSCDHGQCTRDRRRGDRHNLTAPSCSVGAKWHLQFWEVKSDSERQVGEQRNKGATQTAAGSCATSKQRVGQGARHSIRVQCSCAAEPVLPGRPTSMSTSHWLHATPDEGTTTLLMPLCTAACKQGHISWSAIRHQAVTRQEDCCGDCKRLFDTTVRHTLQRGRSKCTRSQSPGKMAEEAKQKPLTCCTFATKIGPTNSRARRWGWWLIHVQSLTRQDYAEPMCGTTTLLHPQPLACHLSQPVTVETAALAVT